jgi:signal transduction histidine kinase
MARKTVFEAVEDAVIVVDDDLCILDYNDAAAEAFARLDGEEGAALADRIPALITGDGTSDPFAQSFTHDHDDGARHYDVTVSPLEIGGETRGYGLVVRDVTENRKHVRDLEQQTERLERFARTLSHDIRNPLSVAEGRVQIAMETGDIDNLEAASRAHGRISRIIDDVLELAREGRRIDDPDEVRVVDVLRSAWETTDTGDATFDIEDGANLVVYADPPRLQRAFENLIRNAIEHGSTSPPASSGKRTAGHGAERPDGTVTVTFGRHGDGFYIEDDGPGIPLDERERVFEYEFTTDEEGTGLGLALVDEIARAHGWSVEMSEGSEGGARVVFSDVESIDTG